MKRFRILGMMSGTSLDGLDLALAELTRKSDGWSYRLMATQALPYEPAMRERLQASIGWPAAELLAFHAEYGTWLGKQAALFLDDLAIEPDAVASHGHTVHHRPDRGFTFQLGCPQRLALACKRPVVGDFRSLDIALGGQGAPLVPVGDRLLFGQYDFCLNLGGISNVSFERDGKRIAFDIGIANMLLNHLSRKAGLEYDAGGDLARSGRLLPGLLKELDALPYYRQPFPKSTGYEWFSASILPLLEAHPGTPADQLRTGVEHIAGQIAGQVGRLSGTSPARVLVTGGGAFNTYLMAGMRQKTGERVEWVIPDAQLVGYKEALVFALLGALRLEGEANVLASVTGASRDSCSGVLYRP